MPKTSINMLTEEEKRIIAVEARKSTPSYLIAGWVNCLTRVVRSYRAQLGYEEERNSWREGNQDKH